MLPFGVQILASRKLMVKYILERKIFFLCPGFIFLLVACTSTNNSNKDTLDSIAKGPLDGIWMGEFDIRGRGPYDFTVVHLNDKAYAYSLKAKAMCLGTLRFDGEHSFHEYVLFALDGGPFDWANVTGTLKKDEHDQKLLASYFKTLNGGDTGALNIVYSNIYDQSSSLRDIQGEWIYTDRDELTTSYSIDEQGMIIGDDTDGCEYMGNVNIINPDHNVYKITVEIKECGSTSGKYEGVSFLEEGLFKLQIANPRYALYYAFEKSHNQKQ